MLIMIGRRRQAAGCLAVALAWVVLTGCGEDTDSTATDEPTASQSSPQETDPATPSATPSAAPFPDACEDIWVDGQKLPARYRGCTGPDGAGVKAKKYHCSSGQQLVVYDGRFYAVTGKTINEVDDLETSSAFQSALSACQA